MRIISKIFIGITILITVLSLTGYLGHYDMYLEQTANFKLQYLLLAIPCFFYFIFYKRYLWFGICLFCILLNLFEILPWYFPLNQNVIDRQSQPLRVFLFNVLHENTRYNDAINLVKQKKVDIAVFLEATPPWDTELKVLNKNFPYHFSSQKLQIEIYSKIPLEKTEIQLYGTYRGLITSQLKIGDREILFVATHAYPQLYYGREGWDIRNQQLEIGIGENLKKRSKSIILVGDLNTTMWSPQYKSMIDKSQLHNTRFNFGILPTQSAYSPSLPWLSIPLDHCLVSQDISIQNMTTGKNIGSDHLPVIVDLLIPIGKK